MKGFTLIELLVVVLIIGILAAVAVPQYQRAVLKSRLAAVIPNVASLKQVAEVYYMANGQYVDSTDIFEDAKITGCNRKSGWHASVLYCDNNVLYDIWSCPNNQCKWNISGTITDDSGYLITWSVPLDYAVDLTATQCLARIDNAAANAVCKSYNGVKVAAGKCSWQNGKNCNIYNIP